MVFSKQIARILVREEDNEKAVKFISDAYKDLNVKEVYETFDFAEFLKNNEKFEKSIIYYTDVLNLINQNHPLYSEAD